MKTSVIIGRWQVVTFAHQDLINLAAKDSDQLILVIGSANTPPSERNPFDALTRMNTLERLYKEMHLKAKLLFVTIPDLKYNDLYWANEVRAEVVALGGTENLQTSLYTAADSTRESYVAMFPNWSIKTVTPFYNGFRASDARKYWYENKGDSLEGLTLVDGVQKSHMRTFSNIHKERFNLFIEEWNYYQSYKKDWEVAPYPVNHCTADALVTKGTLVLLIKRKVSPGKGLWALPGGFKGPNETFELAALRELKEETKIAVPFSVLKNHIINNRIFDDPHRSQRGTVITRVFHINLPAEGNVPEVKADSDADGAYWVPIRKIWDLQNSFFEDHFDIIMSFLTK